MLNNEKEEVRNGASS